MKRSAPRLGRPNDRASVLCLAAITLLAVLVSVPALGSANLSRSSFVSEWIALLATLVIWLSVRIRSHLWLIPILSLILTGAGKALGWVGGQIVVIELMSLLFVLWQLSRGGRGRQAGLGILVTLSALAVLQLRVDDGYSDFQGTAVIVACMFAVLTVSVYLRRRSEFERSVQERIRYEERISVAADLHDLAAHHLTGVLLQAQVASTLVDKASPLADAVGLMEVESEKALGAMRALVKALHSRDRSPLDPPSGLDDLAQIAKSWSHPHADLTLEIPDSLPDLGSEVLTTVQRVVQESLTNVLRHAPDATHVDIAVTLHTDDTLKVQISNDGLPLRPIRNPIGGAGGYGLLGLAERVELLHGELKYQRFSNSWVVQVFLPIRQAGRLQ